MNKFLDKRVKPSTSSKKLPEKPYKGAAREFLDECAACWNALGEARRKLRRSLMYSYGDQWGDYVKDPDTRQWMTEGDLIKKNGKVPLKNNMIAPILSNIDGQLRQQLIRPVCVTRDQSEAAVGEMMSIAIEYVHDINEIEEVDSDSMRMLLNGGMTAQRIEYGINPAKDKCDVWVYGVNPARLFFNSNLEDVRQWDVTCIGELFDMPLDDVLAHFVHTAKEKEHIRNIYSHSSPFYHSGGRGVQGDESRELSFYSPSRGDLCRVILGWHLESRDAYFWNDTLRGTWGYTEYSEEQRRKFEAENELRRERAKQRNIPEEDVLGIEANRRVAAAALQLIENSRQLFSQKGGDDGRRGLTRPQAVGIGGRHHGRLQQAVVAVYGCDDVHQEGDELQVLRGTLARAEEVYPRVGTQRPVVVFARAVDPLEGFFVEQDAEVVASSDLLHQGH